MMLIVYLSAKTFHQINFYGYNYLRRPKSISQINNLRSKKTLNDLVKQVDYCLNESKKRGFLNQKDYFMHLIRIYHLLLMTLNKR